MAQRQSVLNLATKPFANRRPIKRAGVALWSIALILSVINGLLFWGYQSGSSEGRETLERVRSEISTEGETLRALSEELRAFDLQALNPKADFLNERIAERTFPWSRLFDDLVKAMPIQVRLSSLSPRPPDERQRRRRERAGEASDWIALDIRGFASNGEALLDFVDALFEHPSFAAPTLLNERRDDGGEVSFALTARYRSKPVLGETEDPSTTTAFDVLTSAETPPGDAPATSPAAVSPAPGQTSPRQAGGRGPRAEPLSGARAREVDSGAPGAQAAPAPVEFSHPSASATAAQGGRR